MQCSAQRVQVLTHYAGNKWKTGDVKTYQYAVLEVLLRGQDGTLTVSLGCWLCRTCLSMRPSDCSTSRRKRDVHVKRFSQQASCTISGMVAPWKRAKDVVMLLVWWARSGTWLASGTWFWAFDAFRIIFDVLKACREDLPIASGDAIRICGGWDWIWADIHAVNDSSWEGSRMGIAKEMTFASVAAFDEPETLFTLFAVRLAELTLAGFHMLYLENHLLTQVELAERV